MKKISISGTIGYDWWSDDYTTAKTIKEQCAGILDGEDIEITVNSPGGDVYEGTVIFNLIRDYAQSHAVTVRINTIAMSMGSYIALAARTVNRNANLIVSDNSVFMIHNPWAYGGGDYRDFQREATYLEKLSVMCSGVYAALSGSSEKNVRKAMDDETYYVGKEIVDAGFATTFEASINEPEPDSEKALGFNRRDTLIINSKLLFDAMIDKARSENHDSDRAAARFKSVPESKDYITCYNVQNDRGGSMRPEELLAQDKTCYDAVIGIGAQAALERERKRINAHIKLGRQVGSVETALKYIESGQSVLDEDVHAEYLGLAISNQRIAARDADNPSALTVDSGADDDAIQLRAFDLGAQGKTLEGKAWM
ncbi:hypothetical protein FACS1894164_11050 [Spirochaetia bacterium]|nr:hypothetical protein FACS1894164_11050 [Spirochaetia bacterium]